MNKLLRNPIINCIGLSVFSVFYSVLLFAFSDLIVSQTGATSRPLWKLWDSVLIAGEHQYLVYGLLVLTVLAIALLLFKHKPYDEYHTAILMRCLAVSLVLTLAAVGVLFIAILIDPVGIISKMVLFILMQWAAIVAADLVYLLLCTRQ